MTDQVHLSATAELDETPERPKIEILAYSGQPVKTAKHGRLVIDLSGIVVSDTTPLLRNHDDTAILGIVDSHRIDADGLHVEATVTGDDEHSAAVLSHSRNGFKWRASVGVEIIERETLPRGRRRYVNGRSVSGPAIIAKRSEIFEVSLTALPADRDTRAVITASRGKIMSEEVEVGDGSDQVELERERLDRLDSLHEKYLSDPFVTNRDAIEARLSRAIGDGSDPSEVEVDVLKLTRDYRGINTRHPQNYGGVSGSDHVKLSLMVQAGYAESAVKQYGEQAVEAAVRRPVRLSQLFDTARLSSGFSTNSVSNVLADVANKVAVAAYEETRPTWEQFASIKVATDYRPHHALRLSNLQRLEPVGKGGEIVHSVLGDEDYPFRVNAYAQLLALTEQDIVNDDLGAFSDVLPAMARAARQTVDDLIYSTISDATAGSHWSAGRDNKLEAGSDLSAESLGDAITAIRTQKHPNGATLALAPRVLVVAPEQEFTARALLSSTEVLGTAGPAGNPLRGIVQLQVEPRLESPNWFLFAGPESTPLLVAFLNGQRQPRVETEAAAFDQLGMRFRVTHRFGAALGDYKASVFATGAAE